MISFSSLLPTYGDGMGETVKKLLAVFAQSSRVSSPALESSRVLKGASGTLISVIGYNDGPAQFIQLHDAAALPANGVVPVVAFTVPAKSNFSLDVPTTGLPFASGIVVCNSSTAATKTIGGADCFFTAIVR